LKDFLTERGVRYTLKDLRTDPEARREFVDRGYRLPPVTVIDGVPVEGFRPDRLDALLFADEPPV
jgi:glutaredoxin